MDSVRLAVIGAGLIGKKHAGLISADDTCSLAGICDSDPKCRSIADDLNVPFYQDMEELLERDRPDGAIIATPNELHADGVELCAKHSVHVLVEKPVAGTSDDARRIVNSAAECGIEVLVGHHRRHNPLIGKTKALVKDGTLGKLVAVSVLWTILKPADYYDVDWRCVRPSGGPTLINLIHELDSLRFICGEVRSVFAQSSSTARGLEVEDSLSATLTFENGVLGSILASDATPAPWSYEMNTGENPHYFHTNENCYRFFGTMGSLAFPQMELWRYADESRKGWQHAMEMTRCEVEHADPLVRQLKHFCRVARHEEKPLVDARDGARSLAVALAVLESNRCHSLVELSGVM